MARGSSMRTAVVRGIPGLGRTCIKNKLGGTWGSSKSSLMAPKEVPIQKSLSKGPKTTAQVGHVLPFDDHDEAEQCGSPEPCSK